MIKSTPRSCSKERMLRPSRPMIRPFISSLGKATTETVLSFVTSCAYLVRAKPNNSLAFSSHSSLASSSFCLMKAAISLLTLLSTRLNNSSRASCVDI